MRTILGIATALALSLSAASAFAHAALQRAVPAVGSEVSGSPRQVQLWFSEALEPTLSKALVKDGAGKIVNADQSAVADDDRRRIDAPVAPLPPGTYRVEWSVVSVDGHKTSGNFAFTVK
jgi:methionine-rich copper-binding protein CopC